MILGLKQRRTRSAAEAAERAGFKARVARIFGLGPDDAATVSEIACPDPGCSDVETVILLMPAGQPTRAVKLPHPMAEISDEQIEAAAAGDRHGRRRG